MTLPDTPNLAHDWCPGCEPDRDPLREILGTRWCDRHEPPRDGLEDARVRHEGFLSGTAEAGGEDNRRWCDLVRGREP